MYFPLKYVHRHLYFLVKSLKNISLSSVMRVKKDVIGKDNSSCCSKFNFVMEIMDFCMSCVYEFWPLRENSLVVDPAGVASFRMENSWKFCNWALDGQSLGRRETLADCNTIEPILQSSPFFQRDSLCSLEFSMILGDFQVLEVVNPWPGRNLWLGTTWLAWLN